MLSLREGDDGTQEVRCRRTKNRKSATLSTDKRAMILQLIACRRFRMTIVDVKSAFLVAERDRTDPINRLLNMTMPKGHVKKGLLHLEQLFEVRGGHSLGDQPQLWCRTFERFLFASSSRLSATWTKNPNKQNTSHKHFKSDHDVIYVVDMEGAQKKNLKFDQTLNGSVICFDTIHLEYIKKAIHTTDRAEAEDRTHGSVVHIPSKRTLVTTWWSQTRSTSLQK